MKTLLKLSLATVIAITAVLSFSSCGKYDDGPKISLKSKTARICREWMDPSCSTNCGTIEYKKDGTVYSNGAIVSGYTWKFSGDKESIEVTYTIGGFSGSASAKILRLTSKDLWTQDTGSNTIDKLSAK
ncbi:MAG: hypothetical protein HY841_09760 [Bacteroidetes bacterium]|nr:hypothetical protein [Bacteroidota bacterium]